MLIITMFGQYLGVAEVIRNVDVVTNQNRLTNKSKKYRLKYRGKRTI